MKKVSLIRRLTTIVVALCVFTTFAFADGETTEVFLTGHFNFVGWRFCGANYK